MVSDAASGRPGENGSYTHTVRRIHRNIAIVAIAGSAVAFPIWGWRLALAFLAGAVASYFNFSWLDQAVGAMGPNARPTKKRIFVLISLRYVLLLAAGYVIVKVFGMKAIAALAGLFVPVAAIILEILSRALIARLTTSGTGASGA
jgi:hypothetical protein